MYKIVVDCYIHDTGHDIFSCKEVYEDLNTAKRKLVEAVLKDANLYEKDSSCIIYDDLKFARTEGGKDHTEYWIEKFNIKICKDKSELLSNDELNKMIRERVSENETCQIAIIK